MGKVKNWLKIWDTVGQVKIWLKVRDNVRKGNLEKKTVSQYKNKG